MTTIEELTEQVKSQGEKVRVLKAENKAKEEVDAEVEKLKALKKQLEKLSLAEKKEKNPFNRPAIDDVLARRFFVRPSFDIYGGVAGLYDLGPPGCAVQANILQQWRNFFILEEQMLELDCTIMTKHEVFKASGHVDRFTDLMVKDVKTHDFMRADHLLEEHLKKLSEQKGATAAQKAEYESVSKKIDDCGPVELGALMKKYDVKSPAGNDISEPYPFNLMFGTQIGPTGTIQGYLRPETAQGMFVNFKYLLEYNNGKMPFAAAQIGRSFRNEISPKSGLLRVREFTMAEIEHFVKPTEKNHPKFKKVADLILNLLPAPPKDKDQEERVQIKKRLGDAVADGTINNETLGYFIGRIYLYLLSIGIKEEYLRFRQHGHNEMAHYASDCWDAEIFSSYGWVECVGCADRSCYDLEKHEEATRRGLFAQEKLDQPITKEVTVVEANMGFIGKTYKSLGKQIKEHLDGLKEDGIRALGAQLASGSAKITVNGQEVELTKEAVTIKTVTQKISVNEYTPGVIEPSFGIGRILYSLLEHSFWARENDEQRVVLSFKPSIAPVKCLLAPLSTRPEFEPFLEEIAEGLRKHTVSYKIDDSSNPIGRRYARADELGIPFHVVVDFQTTKDRTATIRERDTTVPQIRVPIADIPSLVQKLCLETEKWENVLKVYPHHTGQDV